MGKPLRLALLISRGGTTATAIIKACASGSLAGIEPACVISSRADASGIELVKSAGIAKEDVYVVAPKDFSSEDEFARALLAIFEKHQIDLVGQYGWMTKTPAAVVQRYKDRMINQHPGPLDPGRPDFGGEGMYGMRVCATRLFFVRKTNHDFWTEATAQRVGVSFDEGAVVKSERVPIVESDTPESLSARMLPVEHQVQIAALQDFANNSVNEIHRNLPLIAPHEIEILNQCKKEAILKYPKG